MALIKCSECGKEVSEKATSCPHCGNPIEQIKIPTQPQKTNSTKRKNELLILIALIFIGVLISQLFKSNSSESKKPIKSEFARIEKASQQQIEHVKAALKKGFTIDHVYTIKSKDFKRVYFVAGKIGGPGLGNSIIGVWSITGAKDSPGLIFAANYVTKEFSVVPLGSETKFKISMSDDGAHLVENYVRQIK